MLFVIRMLYYTFVTEKCAILSSNNDLYMCNNLFCIMICYLVFVREGGTIPFTILHIRESVLQVWKMVDFCLSYESCQNVSLCIFYFLFVLSIKIKIYCQ